MQFAREVNESVAEVARKLEFGDGEFEFFCECEAEDCVERLPLTVSAYDLLRGVSEPLLVDGHLLVRAAEAMARADDLTESSSALYAQSTQQQARARRNRQTRAQE